MTLEEIVEFYRSISSKLPEKGEILVGMGNAYFNSGIYSEAKELYLKASELIETCKIYEYLALIVGH
jgi:tetratricopeptide (TPR) repeat protein